MPELGSLITEYRRIINFRNVMVHGYAQIVSDTVWGVVETGLPVLQDEVNQLIESSSSAAKGD